MSYYCEDIDSSLIKDLEYNEKTLELKVTFRKYYAKELIYLNVPFIYFEEFSCPTGKSHGKFYLEMIKPKFKLKNTYIMADKKDLGVNKSSGEKRFIKMRLSVDKINKDWLYVGEQGIYADVTLALLPDGTIDKYGHLGMVTQDVPSEVYKKDKEQKGVILGNGFEFKRSGAENSPSSKLTMSPGVDDGMKDDLPF